VTYTETDLVATIERMAETDLAALTQAQRDQIDQFHGADPRPWTDSCPTCTWHQE
jgi:hypothetical protein